MTPTVRLTPEFVNKVCDLIERIGASEIKSGTEILGPLFGTNRDGLVAVQAFRVVPVHDLRIGRQEYFGRTFERLLAIAKTDPELAALELIGWCCIRSVDSKGLLESDTEFHNHRFPGPNGIALILRPDPRTGLSVELYARSPDGVILGQDCCWGASSIARGTPATGPIDISITPKSGAAVHHALTKASDPGGKTESQTLLAPSDPQPSSPSALSYIRSALSSILLFKEARLSWISAFLVIAIAAIAMFLGIHLHANSPGPVAKTPAAPATVTTSPGVGMKVEAQQGDRLLVTWNRESPIVESAKYGILYIDDGPQHKEVDFAPGEMRGGSILYRPASDEVTFRLQVLGRDDSLITESVRVLDGAMAVAMNTNAQKQHAYPAAAPLISARRTERPEPPKTSAITNRVTPEHVTTNPNPADSASSEPSIAVAPPPKLSIMTPPPAADTDLPSLPKPLVPPASPASETPRNNLEFSMPAPPRPLKRVLPVTSQIASSEIYKVGEVEVDVNIDEAGHVTGARLVNKGNAIPATLGDAALRAARQWTFAPARMHGKPVASDHAIVFKFQAPAQ